MIDNSIVHVHADISASVINMHSNTPFFYLDNNL